jgi:hypothetical protein
MGIDGHQKLRRLIRSVILWLLVVPPFDAQSSTNADVLFPLLVDAADLQPIVFQVTLLGIGVVVWVCSEPSAITDHSKLLRASLTASSQANCAFSMSLWL